MEKNDEILYGNLVENITDGVLVTDIDGTIRLVNHTAAEMLDVQSGEQLPGRTLMELMPEKAENDEFFQCILEAIYSRKMNAKVVPYIREDGIRRYRVVASLLTSGEERIGLIVLLSDLTALIELGEKNEALNRKLTGFVDRFVQVMIGAVEDRTPYNANHTKNMVRYAKAYLDWLKAQGRTEFEDHRIPFLASVWLHDIGKLVVPRSLMDKATRLGNREKDVLHRIEVASLCEKLRMVQGTATGADTATAAAVTANLRKLADAQELILRVNRAGYVDEEDRKKLEALGEVRCLTSDGSYIPLLDEYELEALLVRRGTLTAEERGVMESHVVHTREMLEKMGFSDEYQDVCLWAGGHHELLDGSGYPQHLTKAQIPRETRLLTIIDIYDSLTADDRPYKPAMSPQKAFGILRQMCEGGKLDREILEDFYASGAWKKAGGA